MQKSLVWLAPLCLILLCWMILVPQKGEPLSQEALMSYIESGLEEEQGRICFPKTAYVTKAALHSAYSTLLATEPSLFYVSHYYTVTTTVRGAVTYVEPKYTLTGDALSQAKKTYESALQQLIAPCRTMATEREQLTYLHDYLLTNYTYDSTQTIFDAYRLLTEKRGVCQAFSLLFQDLCNHLAIPAEVVVSFEENHQWNQVTLEGVALSLDLIWDLSHTQSTTPSRLFFLLPEEDLIALRGGANS